ncbi:TetR family transcriptional regulator [Egicoccus sp. AB-alg6-2]|uniref:TetR family transcriptional regulator n=1 Tax=Egicoccus sp. AB-alg6-2 TaxID=3242692 RepID=UPI00359E2D2E
MDLRDRKRDVVRRAILESAYSLFVEHGFDDTTVEMVAARAGVSGRTVYRYFESKEAIVFEELAGEIDELAAAVRLHCSDRVQMSQLVTAFAEWLGRRSRDPLFATLAKLMRDNDALMSQADSWRRALAERIATEIAQLEGSREPRLVDHARAAAVIWVSTAAISTWVRGGSTEDLEALAHEAGAVLLQDLDS